MQGRWRIDIVADQASIIEVKHWRGPATRTNVAKQLTCYRNKAKALTPDGGIGFDLNGQLNDMGWAMPFVVPRLKKDANGDEVVVEARYCAWAPSERVGHVYFAPLTHEEAKRHCPTAADEGSDIVDELLKAIAELAVEAIVKTTLLRVLSPYLPANDRTDDPDEESCSRVQAARVPEGSRQLVFDYGDGTSASATIGAGSGVAVHTFCRAYPFGIFIRSATLSGAGYPVVVARAVVNADFC